MGTNCSTHAVPCPNNRCNQCDVSIGERPPEPMEAFCTLEGVGGNSYRNDFCTKMSSAGEWETGGQGAAAVGSCDYNDCNKYQDFGWGCCNGCCGIDGHQLKCQRVNFTGDAPICCLLDYNCSNPEGAYAMNGNTGFCFSDGINGQQHTCPNGVGFYPDGTPVPNYRDVTTPDCQNAVLQYCTGADLDPNDTSWLDRWTLNNGGRGSCSYAIARNLYTQPNEPCFVPLPGGTTGICNLPQVFPINSSGYFWSQQLVTAALDKYTAQGFQIGALPGFQGFNPFQDFLYTNVCCPFPGLCQDGLDVACANYNSQRISLNPSVAQWCGCHLPSIEYEEYSVKYNIPPECTPMCNRTGTIPIVGINADPVVCQQSVCLMDGVTVNLVNSQIGGGLNFDQICGTCPSGQCSCIVTDTSVDVVNSTINGNLVPIGEGCNNTAVCTQLNPGPTGPQYITVPCGATAINPYDQYEAQVAQAQALANKSSIFTTLIVIGLAVLLIFLIILVIHPTLYETTYTVAVPLPPTLTAAPPPPPPPKLPRPAFITDTTPYTSIYAPTPQPTTFAPTTYTSINPPTPQTPTFLSADPWQSIHDR